MSGKKRKLRETAETDDLSEEKQTQNLTPPKQKRQRMLSKETIIEMTHSIQQTIAQQRRELESEETLKPAIRDDPTDEFFTKVLNNVVYKIHDPILSALTKDACFIARERRRREHYYRNRRASHRFQSLMKKHMKERKKKKMNREIRKRGIIQRCQTDVVRGSLVKPRKPLIKCANSEIRHGSRLVTSKKRKREPVLIDPNDKQVSREQSATLTVCEESVSLSPPPLRYEMMRGMMRKSNLNKRRSVNKNSNHTDQTMKMPRKLIPIISEDDSEDNTLIKQKSDTEIQPVKLIRRTKENQRRYDMKQQQTKNALPNAVSLLDVAAKNMQRTRDEFSKVVNHPDSRVFKVMQILLVGAVEGASYGLAWLADQIRPDYI